MLLLGYSMSPPLLILRWNQGKTPINRALNHNGQARACYPLHPPRGNAFLGYQRHSQHRRLDSKRRYRPPPRYPLAATLCESSFFSPFLPGDSNTATTTTLYTKPRRTSHNLFFEAFSTANTLLNTNIVLTSLSSIRNHPPCHHVQPSCSHCRTRRVRLWQAT